MYRVLKGVKGYLIIQEVGVERFQVTCLSFIDLFYFLLDRKYCVWCQEKKPTKMLYPPQMKCCMLQESPDGWLVSP